MNISMECLAVSRRKKVKSVCVLQERVVLLVIVVVFLFAYMMLVYFVFVD